MQKFQWLLNPRQVFDLTDGGPGPAIEMFRHVPNIKLLACGGDGTVGWLLSVLDKVTIDPPPAVGVLPLGNFEFSRSFLIVLIFKFRKIFKVEKFLVCFSRQIIIPHKSMNLAYTIHMY